jgi:multidrug efflux system outer membrane protein
VLQAQTTVDAARRDSAAYEAQVRQDRHALDLLVGGTLAAANLPQAGAAAQATQLVAVPAELPSSVLQRRPDVLAAEHQLKAANADVGAARAALFPSISLTAQAGTASRSLGDLFRGGGWTFAPSVSLPIFDGGSRRAAVTVAEVTSDIRLASYDYTVQSAFREVADALAVRATLDARLSAQQALGKATQRSLELAEQRYRSGADSYLTVLDAQRTAYAARQSLIGLQLTEQINRVTLFKVLGGGWV